MAAPQPLLQRQHHPFPAVERLSEEKLEEKGASVHVICCRHAQWTFAAAPNFTEPNMSCDLVLQFTILT